MKWVVLRECHNNQLNDIQQKDNPGNAMSRNNFAKKLLSLRSVSESIPCGMAT
jgi:hypothetical protein